MNGPKATKSSSHSYKKASSEELANYNEMVNKKTKSSFQKSLIIAEELEEDIKNLNEKLLAKQNLGWEEKKDLQDILKKQKMLEEQIEKTQNKNKQSRTDQKNPELLKKQKDLEKLMNSILNENTEKLINELKELLNDPKEGKTKKITRKT